MNSALPDGSSDDKVKKAFRCGVYGETGSTCQGQCLQWHRIPPITLESYCSKVKLMSVWVGWGMSRISPPSLPWCSPFFPHWTASVPFRSEPSPHCFFPIAFPTVPSHLAAGAVVSFCPAGPWVSSLGSCGPLWAFQAWWSPPLLMVLREIQLSGFWIIEPTNVLFQFKTSPAHPTSPASPLCTYSVQKHTLKSPFPQHHCVPALSNCALCAPIPLGHKIPLLPLAPQSHFSPSHCSSRAHLALIRPQGNGAGGRNDRNKYLSLGYVVSCWTQCSAFPARMELNLPVRAQEQLWHRDI